MSCTLTSLTRRTALGLATLSLAALTLSAAHPAAAAAFGTTITANGATFTPGASDISQLDFSGGLDGGQDYTSSPTPGQTFTTGSNSLGYLLNNLTLKGGNSYGSGYETGDFYVDISSVSGTTLTNLGTFIAPAAPLLGHESEFFTIDLSAPNLTLASGTQYAYDIWSYSGFFGLSRANIDVYTGGSAFKGDQGSKKSPTSFTSFTSPSYDRTFNVGLTANLPASAPEASQTLAMSVMALGLGGLLMVARRRRALL